MSNKPKLVSDLPITNSNNDSGLYDSNISGPVEDIEGGDDDDFAGSAPDPEKVSSQSTLDMEHRVGAYQKFTDDGEGNQGELNVAEQIDEIAKDQDK